MLFKNGSTSNAANTCGKKRQPQKAQEEKKQPMDHAANLSNDTMRAMEREEMGDAFARLA